MIVRKLYFKLKRSDGSESRTLNFELKGEKNLQDLDQTLSLRFSLISMRLLLSGVRNNTPPMQAEGTSRRLGVFLDLTVTCVAA